MAAAKGESKSFAASYTAPAFRPSNAGAGGQSAGSSGGAAKSSAESALFKTVSNGLAGRPKLSLRVDQPVESVSTKTTAYIRGQGPVDNQKTKWKWCRSTEVVTCMYQNCQFSNRVASFECIAFGQTVRFCSYDCLRGAWPLMRRTFAAVKLEDRKREAETDADVEGRVSCGDVVEFPKSKWDGLAFTPVAETRSYVPTSEDVGRLLRLNVESDGISDAIETEMVIPMPSPPPDRRVLVNPQMPPAHQILSNERIRVVNYNLLAAIYATSIQYPYCPQWALSWNFRRDQIVRELAGYQADVLCLQEVQHDHYDNFLLPRMQQLGYEGLYKQKTRPSQGPPGRVDGCALFYKVSKFELKEKYVIEFNDAARVSASQGHFKGLSAEEVKSQNYSNRDKNRGLNRVCKDNVAQIAVLEIRDIYGQYGYMEHPPRICVSNVHIFWDPQFADVKLWQTHILIKELQKFTLTKRLPLILGGDFNSEPKSSVHDLLSTAQVQSGHPDLAKDSVGILPHSSKLTHSLPLRSAYATVRGGMEPSFTNYTGHYVGTLDYIWYSADTLVPVAVLDTYSTEEMASCLGRDHALPSPQFPSDHLSLCCDFQLLHT